MDFFETPEEVARLLEAARAKLKDFEENVEPAILIGRLKAAHPFHPALLVRALFLTISLFALMIAIAIGALPFAMEEAPEWMVSLERMSSGLPLPLVAFVLAICCFVAYFGASQAALYIGRDCPLLPEEQREHERLLNEVKRLSSQKAIMDRVRGTPMGARPRTATPAPMSRFPVALGSAGGASGNTPPVGIGRTGGGTGGALGTRPRSPTPRPAERSYTPPIVIDEDARATPSAAPIRHATPLGAAPRAGTPVGKLGRSARLEGRTPPPAVERVDEDVTDSSRRLLDAVPTLGNDEDDEDDVKTGGRIEVPQPSLAPSSHADGGAGYEQRSANDLPKWGPVDEPWLEDAIQKSEILAAGFPVQAHLLFSAEPNLPFTLVLERATPAMAVRAMVSYVEFLASVATPPRARIVLRSVPHLDRSFHRNVEAALEPYFGEKVQVIRNTDAIDIKFLEWDTNWKNHPRLPIA